MDESNVDQLIVFSHNDVQENNFLNKKGPDGVISDAVVIDFEYSELNYRGVDIASYLIETSINYKTALECGFEYYEHLFPNINEKAASSAQIEKESPVP